MERWRCPLSRQQLQEAEQYGGSDWEDWPKYNAPNNEPSCDKGGHRERSIANQPNHLKHRKSLSK